MTQSDQKQPTPSDSFILFDIEILRSLEQNCLDDVIASIAKWLGRNHELMYTDAWNFTFLPEVSGQDADISARLQIKDQLDKGALERFHGLRSIEHFIDSPLQALSLIQHTLEAGVPVVLGINSFWVPWDDGYQQQERRHSCIVVGMNPHTQDLYCTDPYFKQKGMLLPRSDFLKGYLFCETFRIVSDECSDLSAIVDTILERLRDEITDNRPFIQMRDLANTLLTSFQDLQKADAPTDSLEVPLFVQLTNVAEARIKSAQMFTYLGNTYDTRFLAYAERLQKVSSQWRIASAMFMKMHLTSRWTEASLQKIALRILTLSVEEQALAYELLAFLESFKQHGDAAIEPGAAPTFENDWETADEENAYVAPQTAGEREIAALWQEALAVERVGIRDNFFELGGQSLKAASVLSRLGQQFKLHIPISVLFQYPTVQELAQYVADQQAELAGTQRATSSDSVTPSHLHPPIRPRSSAQRQESCPTSFAQQRLWLLDQLHAAPSPYYLLNALRLDGALDVAVLQRSLAEIVRRHEALRTTFFQDEETIFQRISPATSVPLPQVDLQHLAAPEQETEIRLLIQQESQAPFDLHRGPHLRVRLLRLGDQQHILLLAFHHIVTDGWSLDVFTRELVTLYQAFCAEQAASLPELPIQYADYALWQRQQLQGEALEQQVEYWKRQLSGTTGALPLPLDSPRPPIQTFRGAAQQVQLSPTLTQALKHLSQQEGVTLFMTLLAAFQMLLYRYSGQSDITVGTSVANRTHPETEHLIGFFVNTLALRTDLSGNPSVQEVLKRVKTMALGAYEHQELPFEQVVEALQPERTLSHSPLFQVFFVLQNTPERSFSLPGFRVENLDVEQQTAEFDLVLIVEETSTGLQIILEYQTDLFKAETIARMLHHYQQQLNAMLAHPTTGIADLPLLTEGEQQQILLDFNNAHRPRPASCLHTLLAAQATRAPHALAVRYEQDELQYQELEWRANQLAHALQRLGIGPESRVGIALERSLELVVALLGVLKAGGAYVPLDPGYPAERLAFIAQDAEIQLLLTQKEIHEHLPPLLCQQVIELDQEWSRIAQEPSSAPISAVTPENVAYIIYTSGSTGHPKGAMNTHAAITHRLLWMQDTYQLDTRDRVLQKTPYSFDVSVWEFFWPLLTGASLVLAKPDGHKDGRYLIDLITSEQITTLHFVPSLLSAMLEEPEFFACTSLKRVFCSGEALSYETQERFFKGMRAELHNLYGPTEAAVDVSFWQCQAQDPGHIVPIGRPIDNIQLYILDQRANPVPIGVVGELFIGGIALARGYVGAPNLTAEKFLPHPFSSLPGARLYQTGDLARYRPDGVIEFLGRIDHQVKIRGFRIEPGEIETILAAHPAVQESIVLARRYAADDTRLAAYIVPDSQFAAPLRKLLRFAQQGRLNGLQQQQLPNGMTVICKNKAEVAFVQHELLGEQTFLDHGMTLRPGDCVFDVGANIGLFTLLVNQLCPGAQVYAFEPVPPIFEILSLNIELHNPDVRLFACGLTDDATQTSATLTYYPHNSLISGRFANLQEDQAVVKTYLRNQPIAAQTDIVLSNTEIDEILQEQLISEEHTCEMSTLSRIIQREHIQRIDLLKIDVEKSEMDVLRGIQEKDWEKIQQIIVEVHDIAGRAQAMTQLLQEHGFVVQSAEDVLLQHTGLFTLYARRQHLTLRADERQARPTPMAEHDPRGMKSETLIGDIQRLLKQKLPDYMVPSSIHLLDAFPRLPNGKIDRTALLSLTLPKESKKHASRPPQTPTEQAVATIWAEILKRHDIGQEENFFELGGHSLLAMRVISMLSRVFHVQLPLHEFFAHPTLAALAACIERVRQSETATLSPKIRPVSREQSLPLSFAQQRLWLLDQLTPENAFYNLSFVLQLTGKLDQNALEQSFSGIIQRHEVLRTTFTWHDEEAVLSIRSSTAIEIPMLDLSGMDEARSRCISQEVMQREVERPFNLTTGPLLRLHLLCITPEEHILLICAHHSIADGWSMDIFVREFTAFYRHFTEGLPLSLPALPVQYADFAVWQRQWLSGEVLAKQQSYWLKQLAGTPPLLELPTDYPRPSIQTFSGASLSRGLPTRLTSDLLTLSQREGVTLFMLLLAAFQTLLSRYSGQSDIVVGTPLASRSYEDVEHLIGFFVNTLVLRGDLSGNPSFQSLLARVRQVCLDAYAHQDIPFEHLVEILQVKRTLSHNPLFQVMFTLQNSGAASLRLPGLTIEPLIFDDHVAKFDLSLTVVEDGQTLTLEANYNRDLFSDQTIRNLLEHYQMLLQGVATNPSQVLDELPLLTSRERAQILYEWNSKPSERSPDRCFYEIFQEQALRSPDAVALIFGEEQLSYHELNRRANQLAHHLLSLGVEPESRVILFTDRSPEAIVGILAIWKAGGIYVPIDPSYPPERVAFLLQDAEATALITRQELLHLLPEHHLHIVNIDMQKAILAQQSRENPASRATLQNGAYMIYTSGSTGKPKAVLVEQGSLINVLRTSQQTFAVRPDDRVPCFASLSFDISLLEIFLPLLIGGTSLLFTREQLLDLDSLVANLDRMTIIHMVPSLMREVVRRMKENKSAQQKGEHIRMIFVGGEAVPPDLLMDLQDLFRSARVHVLYGPTEATIICSSYLVPGGKTIEHHPIGRSLPGMTLTIRDQRQQLVPTGVPGEIYIGGPGVARGYFKREELTNKAFLVLDNERCYKTGDLARYRHDGTIEYLGRVDTQVKLRGYRIELEEIEQILHQYPEVEAATVMLREDVPGKQNLVAYVVRSDKSSTGEDVPGTTELWPSIGEYRVYDELIYYGLTNDERRNRMYKNAMQRLVKDKVVVDIGTGKDAVLARLCVEAGARKVYAVEELAEVSEQARHCVRACGLEDKISVISGNSMQVQLPELADVCVSEIFEAIGGAEGAALLLNDARRLLKPEGRMIPEKSITRIAAVSLPDGLREHPHFTQVSRYYVNKIFEYVGYEFDMRLCIKNFPSTHIISSDGIFEELDFTEAVQAEFSRSLLLTMHSNAQFDGFLLWLDLDFGEGENLDILQEQTAWFPVYLPVFYPGLEVSKGDTLLVVCKGKLCEDGIHPDYILECTLYRQDTLPITFTYESKHHRSGYRETAFYQALFSNEDIPIHQEISDTTLMSNVRTRLSQVLPDYMVPSAFVLLDALPLSPNGKLNRHALPVPERLGSRTESTFVAPRTPAEQQLARIWADLLGLEQVSIADDFFASGGHSLLAVRLINHIQEQFGQAIPLGTLFQGRTIEHLAALLEKPLPVPKTSPLVELQHGTARLPFFCIHPVGGNVFCYVELARALGDDLPFYALQAEGLEAGSTPLTSIEEMAAHYIKAIKSIQPRGPYLLGGWSMGGLIALEMARQLQDQQLEVGLVALMDSWAANPPSASRHQRAEMDSIHFIQNFVLDLLGSLEQTAEEWFAGLQSLETEEEQLLFLAERAKQLRILPSDVDHSRIVRLLAVFKANIRAAQMYLPQNCPQPLLQFSAEEELEDEGRAERFDVYELARGEKERYTIPGNHYTILTQPRVQLVAERLRACLDTIQQRMPL